MKKFLSVLLVLVLMLSASACKKQNSDMAPNPESNNVSSTVAEELQPSATPVEIPTDGVETPPVADWKQFLDEYNSYVDQSIVAISAYMADPSNKELLPDYAYAMEGLTERALKAEALAKELNKEMPDVVDEFRAEFEKIQTKLADMSLQ